MKTLRHQVTDIIHNIRHGFINVKKPHRSLADELDALVANTIDDDSDKLIDVINELDRLKSKLRANGFEIIKNN